MDKKSLLQRKFGMLAVSKGHASREQVDQAFLIQKRMLEKTQNLVFLGDILVKMGAMTDGQKSALLSSQSAHRKKTVEKNNPRETIPTAIDRGGPPATISTPIEKGSAGGRAPVPIEKEIPPETPPAPDPPPEINFEFVISDDNMQAFISWPPGSTFAIQPQTIKNALAGQGISYGIITDETLAERLKAENPLAEPFEVASGQAPQPHSEWDVEYHFDNHAPAVMSFDANAQGRVAAGTILAAKVSGAPAVTGTDIFGRAVKAPQTPSQPLTSGPGTRWSDDRLQIIAEREGLAEETSRGVVQVQPCSLIETDAGVGHGDIEFDGHLAVRGSIQGGIRVKAKSLLVKQIQKSNIEIAGDMVVLDGISDAGVKIGGTLNAKYINKSRIEALGSIVVDNEVRNTAIFTTDQFRLEKGRILSSVVTAKKGIRALEIGSNVTKSCQMNIGIDFWAENEIEKTKEAIDHTRERISSLNALIEKLEATNSAKEEEISRHAQVEAPIQAQQMSLRQQLKKLKTGDDREKETYVTEVLEQVDATLAEMNVAVEKLFEEQEAIGEQIQAYQNLVQTRQEEVEDLGTRIKQVGAESLRDRYRARIDALGTIFANTTIKSPHAQQTLAENCQRVRVEEIQESGRGSAAKWSIAVSHLK